VTGIAGRTDRHRPHMNENKIAAYDLSGALR
jgi:hypothetical protein